jgi:antitoxin component YwqK of YwqJK toxin-antitoxin module
MQGFIVCLLILAILPAACKEKNLEDCFDEKKYILAEKDTARQTETYTLPGNDRCRFIKMYFPSGALLSTFFTLDNKIEGISYSYSSTTGKVSMVSHYRQGVLNGTLIRYNEKGEIRDCDEFKDGHIVGHDCPPQ